ncbi:PorT family protein [Phaeodactylibacter luteus]|uniref:PorT family protein n=2 Tax=Phaeodactylibacter luteus TaxID=1564516 RepID=A0A5C6RIW1_9BACT|nr:PorT family protein [Phaeodactylibacter luteus]
MQQQKGNDSLFSLYSGTIKIRRRMKKFVVFATLIFAVAMVGQAQQAVRFGFQLSPTFNWMSTDDNTVNTNGTNLGLKLGLVGEFYFQENYAVTTGLGFSFNSGGTLLHDRGGSYWANSEVPESCRFEMENGPGSNLKYSIQYVEIPVGLKLRTREFGYIRYFFEPNLGLGFRTQANGDIRNSEDQDACTDINIRSDVGLFNVFWGVGGGIEYSVSESTSLVAGLGAQFGFVDVTKDDDLVFVDGSGSNTAKEDSKGVVRGIVLRLGVMF